MTTEHATEITVLRPDLLPVLEGDGFRDRTIANGTDGVENVSGGIVEFNFDATEYRNARGVEETVVVLEGANWIITDDGSCDLAEGEAAIVPLYVPQQNAGGDAPEAVNLRLTGPERTLRERERSD